MGKIIATIKKLGIARISISLISTILLVFSVCFLVKRICFMQHSSSGDVAFFWHIHQDMELLSEGGGSGMIIKSMFSGMWAFIIAVISLVTGAKAVYICHAVIPYIFVILMLVEYLYLGYRLFKIENRGGYYIYVATTCFVTVFIYMMYYLAYNGTAPEGGVYLNCWRENVLAGILLIPLPICTILRMLSNSHDVGEDTKKRVKKDKKKNLKEKNEEKKIRVRDIVLLIIENLLIIGIYTFQNLSRIILEGSGEIKSILNSNIAISWFFIMVVGFILIGLGLRMKGMVPMLIVIGISLLLLCPLPVGLIISYGFASLVTHEDKNTGWMYLSYIILGLVVYVLGRVYTGWVEYSCSFGEIKNKYRVEEGIPELADYITAENESPCILIVEDWADEMEIYDPNIKIHSLTDFTDENFADALAGVGEEVDFVCMHSDPSLGEITLFTNGFTFDTVSDTYMVYKRY